jgi:hypothetical protein
MVASIISSSTFQSVDRWRTNDHCAVALLAPAHPFNAELRSEPEIYRLRWFKPVPCAVVDQFQHCRFHIQAAPSKSQRYIKPVARPTCSRDHACHDAVVVLFVWVNKNCIPVILQQKFVKQNRSAIVVDYLDHDLRKTNIFVCALLNRETRLGFAKNSVCLTFRLSGRMSSEDSGTQCYEGRCNRDPLVEYQFASHATSAAHIVVAGSHSSISHTHLPINGRL